MATFIVKTKSDPRGVRVVADGFYSIHPAEVTFSSVIAIQHNGVTFSRTENMGHFVEVTQIIREDQPQWVPLNG